MKRPGSNHPYQSVPLPSDPFCPTRLDICHESDSEKGRLRWTWSLIASSAVAVVLLVAAIFYGFNAKSGGPKASGLAAMQNGPDSWSGQPPQNSAPVTPGARDVTPPK